VIIFFSELGANCADANEVCVVSHKDIVTAGSASLLFGLALVGLRRSQRYTSQAYALYYEALLTTPELLASHRSPTYRTAP